MKIASVIFLSFSITMGARAQYAADSTRWYMHGADLQFAGQTGTITQQFIPLWFDSTVIAYHTNGLSVKPCASAAQIVDPVSLLANESTIFGETTMGVRHFNSYRVDSILIKGAYLKSVNRPGSIVDTLIFSVAPQIGAYNWPEVTGNSWVGQHLSPSEDTLWAAAPLETDSAWQRINAHPQTKVWKILLDSTMRTYDASEIVYAIDWKYKIPGDALNIPAGQNVAVTVAFRSGDTVTDPNSDSIDQYHHFLLSSHGSDTAIMNYTWYTLNDRSMSSLMSSTATDPQWTPVVALEGMQDPSFAYEYHDIAVHINCWNCCILDDLHCYNAVEHVLSMNISPYPNPAHNIINVPFKLSIPANVEVKLTNIFGRSVATLRLDNAVSGKAEFSTAHLPAGIYFYTIKTEYQQASGHVVITH